MDIKIITATHKKYPMPKEPMYLPVMAGSALHGEVPERYARDDAGDNISDRNGGYSELTALYWAWKNLPADYLGLCHYRRYLTLSSGGRGRHILRQAELEELLREHDVILPRRRRYVIETNYSQYVHAHHRQDLDLTRAVIADRHPEDLAACDRCMDRRSGHRFNLFVMKRELSDAYCEWLFDILFELERRLDTSGYKDRDARVFGLVSERLLDVWLEARGPEYAELPYLMTEKEHMVRKALGLIGRKVRGRKA